MSIIASKEEILKILQENETVAVLGANIKKEKPAYYVAEYLKNNNYDVYPVNPVLAGKELFGQKIVAKLSDLAIQVDIVDIFRRAEHLEAHLEEILNMKYQPKVVWFQAGIKNDKVATILSEAGIDVVQDKCILAEHKSLIGKKDS